VTPRGGPAVLANVLGVALAVCLFSAGDKSHAEGDERVSPTQTSPADRVGPAAAQSYGFGDTNEQALAAYRSGWVAILRDGRWSEAERRYREALKLDPGFTMAKSVLARITTDSAERDALYQRVESERDNADPMDELLLHTYQETLELFARREAGAAPSAGDRRAMAERAVKDYGAFLASYPGEWSVMIEYVEWIHALDGPAAALAAIDSLRAASAADLDFSYFPAWFHAELGRLDEARRLAAAFRNTIDDPGAPQPYFLEAYLHFEAGDLKAAKESVERALALDSRHLLAARLRNRIDAARRDSD